MTTKTSAGGTRPATRLGSIKTDLEIRKLKGAAKPYKRSVGDGLFIRVTPTGKKTWLTRYRSDGKDRPHMLGSYPAMSLAEAKAAREKVRGQAREGLNPQIERTATRKANRERSGRTFEALARKWHADEAKHWKPSYAEDVLARLALHVFPKIGRVSIHDITVSDVSELLRGITAGHIAYRIRQYLVSMFDAWCDQELIDRNPADRRHLKKLTRPEKKSVHRPAIEKPEDARLLLRAIERSPYASMPFKLLHRFLALTSVRPSEAREAKWNEFTTPGVWAIPAERMKGKLGHQKPHWVFLSPQAQEVLDAARSISIGPYVFALRPDAPLVAGTLTRTVTAGAKALRLSHCAHGWRSTFATEMERRRPADQMLIQKMIAHETHDDVGRRYARTTVQHFEADVRAIHREWADLLMQGMPSAWTIVAASRPDVVENEALKLAA